MDFCLIAVSWYLDPKVWVAILEVLVGLGFVIFVHELGHFAVAKMCGVKVEKFFLGFDIGGWKLAKFRWGETLYGIGILPLGGYVKMLGQEDNPARLREEIEKAKQAAADPSAPAAVPEVEIAEAEQALFDPRSYLAKSVPQRIAIISAGVIMNMIFAMVMGVIAYLCGVHTVASSVGQVIAGRGAWQADLKVGDRIVEIDGRKIRNFIEMKEAIVYSDLETGVRLLVERPGIEKPLEFTVKTQKMRGAPGIGVGPPSDANLRKDEDALPVFPPDSAAALARPAFQLGDRIVEIDSLPMSGYPEIQAYLAQHRDASVKVTVVRAAGKSGPAKSEPAKETITVGANPMRQYGIVMQMGEISAIQNDSPAAKSGIQVGDLLRTYDGRDVGDPMTLPDRLRGLAGKEVTLGLERAGKPLEIRVILSPSGQDASSGASRSPVAVAHLGIAYKVLNTVQRVVEGSPAAKADIQPGDVLRGAKFLALDKGKLKQLQKEMHYPDLDQPELPVPFEEDVLNWPHFSFLTQLMLPGTVVEFELARGNATKTVKIEPEPAADWFNPDRGLQFDVVQFVQTAHSFDEALRDGTRKTVDSALAVYATIHRIRTGDVSPRMLGGPKMIVEAALGEARQGFGNLLLFLTLLSANLAVLNFLPIPLLDGGHLVLLLYEGIRGKPADERVQIALAYLGLLFILGLMIFVLGLDFGLISRPMH